MVVSEDLPQDTQVDDIIISKSMHLYKRVYDNNYAYVNVNT